VRNVQIWHTDNRSNSFVHVGSASVNGGAIQLVVESESIYTATSTTGQSHGSFPVLPAPSAPFPTSWADDFDSSAVESLPKYWADQCGSWQIMPSGGGRRGNSILQRVTMRPGKNKWHSNLQVH
jgi:hypothetical protein